MGLGEFEFAIDAAKGLVFVCRFSLWSAFGGLCSFLLHLWRLSMNISSHLSVRMIRHVCTASTDRRESLHRDSAGLLLAVRTGVL